MKRLFVLLPCVLCLLLSLPAAASPTTATDIPVTAEAAFPAAVTEILLDKAFIGSTERLTAANVQAIIDSCQDQFSANDEAFAVVPTETVLQYPALKSCGTVECSRDFVYTTSYKQGVAYEWAFYPDGTVKKVVSCIYDERTSEFKTFRYSIVNDNNQSLQKSRVELYEVEQSLHTGDFLFGMAVAVLLMMIAVVIVRAIKKA